VLIVGLLLGAGVTLAVSVLVDRLGHAEWREIQQAYNLAQRQSKRSPVALGIRAIHPDGGNRRPKERCVSCHLGMVLPDAHAPPLQAHPQMACALDPGRAGCTACHRGEPLKLTAAGAHGLDGASRRRLPGHHLQAGCAQCHLDRGGGILRYDADRVAEVARGMDLFLAQGCTSCHRVQGIYNFSEIGPSLSRVGSRLSFEQLRQRVLRPQDPNVASPMPPVLGLTPEEIQRLVTFLLAQVGLENELGSSAKWGQLVGQRPNLADHFPTDYPAKPNPAAGALWARKVGCVGCHRLGEGDRGVPDLRHVGWTATTEELREALVQPHQRVPGTRMPRLEMPEPVVGSVLAYLGLQKAPLPSSPSQVFGQVCSRCHGKPRDPKWVVLARRPPPLDPRPRALSREAFVTTVSEGRKNSAMAAWGRALSKGFIGSIYDTLAPDGGSR
jgi:mono/diheme cytochrome c family protein